MLKTLKTLKPAQLITLAILIVIFVLFTSQKISLPTADLGRHLKNGEIFFKEHKVYEENHYSYTYPHFEFLNHHWGSGVIFYAVQQLTGFTGLSIFVMLFNIATLLTFFYIAAKYGNFELAVLATVIVIPVISSRSEIRPETFSYFLCGIFFLLLWEYKFTSNLKLLYVLPILELIWVNLHVYFFMGIAIAGVFALSALLTKKYDQFIKLSILIIICSAVSLINPAGLKGALYPSTIFNNYGYRILENQSVIFMDKFFHNFWSGNAFKYAFAALVLSWIAAFKFKTKHLELFILSIALSAIAWKAIRNFSLFAYFAIPIITINLYGLKKYKDIYPYLFTLCGFSLFVVMIINGTAWSGRLAEFGFGLRKGVPDAAEFFKRNHLAGPIFNNYDIGGYLIYYLFPQEKVFIDNRPEAYPLDFFNHILIPMQEDQSKFKLVDKQYNFNTVFFYRGDITVWAQNFMISLIKDPDWAPVYADDYNIIFVKRNAKNAEIIKKLEMPKSMFSITSN
ncbi:MAG TPA: hypothetical protein VLI92_03780 [Candidatus Saccharimonadales bacterium]|nr:hypothetical protein [Candidatus Saccharimonadales bacterium]